jgi:hypothetical protein
MSTIVTRAGKGSPLTNTEVDDNFTNLNTDKVQVTGTPTNGQAIIWNGTAWVPGASATYPAAGIANSTGTAWGTSYSTTGTGTVLALATSPSFTTPILGTPTSGNFSTGTFTWPTFNQNTTGNAATATTATTATNIAAGTNLQIPYNTGAGSTSFIIAPTVTSTYLQYNGTGFTWSTVAAGTSLSNDTSTASFVYPLFAAATSGTASTVYTGDAKLLYKPSTGEFQASELAANNGLILNATTVAASYTIGTGYNAMSVGPVTVAAGQAVTLSSGQRWLIM